jgi:uncharacterized protein (DUF2147 family)
MKGAVVLLKLSVGIRRTLVVCVLALAAYAAPALAQAPIEGTWRTLNGTEVRIVPCDSGFCGTLSWIVIPKEQSGMCKMMPKEDFGSLMLDYKNPDKSLQTRSLIGVQMLTVKPTNDPAAYTASVYNAEDGSTNDVLVWVLNNGTILRLGGGCLAGLCAVTQDWPRAADRGETPDFTCS